MRVLILGGGGLGTVYAGYLGRTGVDVTLLVKPAHAVALEHSEVHITGLDEFTAAVEVTSDPGRLGAYDYLLVCVKGRDTETALAPLLGVPVETVLSFQNGVKKDETLARLFDRERVLGAVSIVGGTLERPGHARHTLAMPTLIGELDGRESSRGERLAVALREAGLPAACVPEILTREWDKLAGFLRTALVSAITRLDLASVLLDPDLVPLCVRIAKEAATVAAAAGHPLRDMPDALLGDVDRPDAELIELFRQTGERWRATGPPTYPSLAQDIMSGRPSELEDTAGDVLARAVRHGVPVPSLATCVHLLRSIERPAVKAAATGLGD
ncbi:MAG: ketopantoate reductase family protein [Dehalococcoidia bacterium]